MLRTTFLDAPERWGFMFQDPASPIARGIHDLHHDIMFLLIVIMIFVFWMLSRTLWFFRAERNPKPSLIVHGTFLEIVWTVIPSLILMVIATPSFALLYSMDEILNPAVTLKVTGNQWYWSYEYSDYATSDEDTLMFDSYMIPEEDLEEGQLRLLEVDNRVVLPTETHIRVLVTARDVIHCWSIPSLAVKCDGIPGRLNQVGMYIDREGLFYGQCSEICGAHHGFMPIVVEGVTQKEYSDWVEDQLGITPETEEKVEEKSVQEKEPVTLETIARDIENTKVCLSGQITDVQTRVSNLETKWESSIVSSQNTVFVIKTDEFEKVQIAVKNALDNK